LKEIKSDPILRQIPVIVLTTSKAEEDVLRTYDLGANSFITKPVTFQGLVDVMGQLGRYWFEIVDLAPPERACRHDWFASIDQSRPDLARRRRRGRLPAHTRNGQRVSVLRWRSPLGE